MDKDRDAYVYSFTASHTEQSHIHLQSTVLIPTSRSKRTSNISFGRSPTQPFHTIYLTQGLQVNNGAHQPSPQNVKTLFNMWLLRQPMYTSSYSDTDRNRRDRLPHNLNTTFLLPTEADRSTSRTKSVQSRPSSSTQGAEERSTGGLAAGG